jgi:hypothetical protein
MRHRRLEIVAKRVPARQDRPLLNAAIDGSLRPSRFNVTASAPSNWPMPPNWLISRFAIGLVSIRLMVSASRYSTNS